MMILGLVSFSYENRKKNDRYVTNIINDNTDCNLILFPGFTSIKKRFLISLIRNNTNRNSLSILEVKGKWYFVKHDNIVNDQPLIQKIENSLEASDKQIVLSFLKELEEKRTTTIDNKNIRLLICGEIYITSRSRQDNEIYFRHKDIEIINRFNHICSETKIFFNPAHRPVPKFFCLPKRCSFLSNDDRICV